MTKHLTALFALTLTGTAAPALAQHDRGPPPRLESWDGEWQGAWDNETTYPGVWRGTYTGADGETVEAEYRGRFIGESRFLSDVGPALRREGPRGWREDRGSPRSARGRPLPPQPQLSGPRFGYSLEERAAWLDECRARAGYGYRDERRGRVDQGGPVDECAAYLDRYEASAPDYPTHVSRPVMMVRVPIQPERSRDCGCTIEVIEEIVEEAPAPRAARRASTRSAPSKRVRITR